MAHSIAYPLSRLFDLSLKSGRVPSDWLVASVTPIYKKGNSSDPSNYRPISLTSAVSKAMEMIVRDEMLTFLKAHKLISPKQHGFLSRRSTVSNVLSTLNNWYKNRLKQKLIHAVYIDFAKAFDTVSVSHPKLISPKI